MNKDYIKNTASLQATKFKAVKADITKFSIDGNPFSKVVSANIPESPTDNDIWKYDVVTDDEGVVTINTNVTVDYAEITDNQKNILKTAIKVIDNKVLGENDTLLMNWDTKNFTNSDGMGMDSIFDGRPLQQAPITEWDSDLSSLTNGTWMFNNTALTSWNRDLPSLTNGYGMFANSALESFSGDLSSLTNGSFMFDGTDLTSWNIDLSSLTNGYSMFQGSTLKSFNIDLPSLTNGRWMFYNTALTSWDIDLPSLTNGEMMFYNSALQSFSGDLSSLTNGNGMFQGSTLKSFNIDLPSLTNGDAMFLYSTLESFSGDLSSLIYGNHMFYMSALASFVSDLSSLKCGYNMFYNVPLEEDSIMFISDTINNISTLDKTVDSDWTYLYHDYDGNLTTETISEGYRGILYLSYDTSITDTTNIFKYCNEIINKGWIVYLNDSLYESSDSNSVSLTGDESSSTPTPHYYKPIQVSEEIAEYVDANNNYYIIVGAQYVFGDDISTYGLFTSYNHAVSEISSSLGLTKYEKPSTETTNN